MIPPILPERISQYAPFQIEDSDFLISRGRAVLGHKTGMGKTVMAIRAMASWNWRTGMILGTRSSFPTWTRELYNWTGGEIIPIKGTPSQKMKLWQQALTSKDGLWVTTHATYRELMKQTKGRPYWDLVAIDEAHKIRNRQTDTFKALRRFDSNYLVPMSATWASRGPQDLWSILNLISPKFFGSYWEFVQTWCYVERTPFGTEIFGVRNLENLRALLRSYYRSRKWTEVGNQMPPVRRTPVVLEMDRDQERLYRDVERDMMATVETDQGTSHVIAPTVLAKITRLRQISICPELAVPGAGMGSFYTYLLDKLEDDPHTVVFTPFTALIPILSRALESVGYKVWSLSGKTKTDLIDPTIAEWKKAKGVMIVSIDFAQSFAVDTVYNAYMFGFDYDPNDNEQAEGRLRRFNSDLITVPCNVEYLMNAGTWDMEMKEIVNGKSRTVRQIFQQYMDNSTKRA